MFSWAYIKSDFFPAPNQIILTGIFLMHAMQHNSNVAVVMWVHVLKACCITCKGLYWYQMEQI